MKLEAYTDGQMESGILEQDRSGPVHSQQGFAMANAQFKSESIYRPWVPNPEVTTLEHKGELTGRHSVTVYDRVLLDAFLAANRSKDSGTVVEGDDFQDKNIDTVAGKNEQSVDDDGHDDQDGIITGCCVYPVGDTSALRGATYTFVDGLAAGCSKPGTFRPSMSCDAVKKKFYSTPEADVSAQVNKRVFTEDEKNLLNKPAYLALIKDLKAAAASEGALKGIFEQVDLDKSGAVTVAEKIAVMKPLYPMFTDAEFGTMVSLADLNKDGEVTYEELVKTLAAIPTSM